MSTLEIDEIMTNEEAHLCGINKLSSRERESLVRWGLRMYGLGQHIKSEVDEVKYDGRLIILADGSRWEVESYDASTAEMWGVCDDVVVIDDRMYKLDESESVSVQQEN